MHLLNRRVESTPVMLYPIDPDDCNSAPVMSRLAGRLLTYQETKLVAERLIRQLENIDSDEFDKRVRNHNMGLWMDEIFTIVSGYEAYKNYPVFYLNVSKKKYKGNQKWSFICGNCGNKITLETADIYYTMTPREVGEVLTFTSNEPTERACNKDCMKVIAKEIAVNSIKKEFFEYFSIPDVMNEVIDYVDNVK